MGHQSICILSVPYTVNWCCLLYILYAPLFSLSFKLRIFTSSLEARDSALFWTEILEIAPGFRSQPWVFWWNHCCSHLTTCFLTLLSALAISQASHVRIATPFTMAFFIRLSSNTMSSWLAFTSLSVSIWKSHRIIHSSVIFNLQYVSQFKLGKPTISSILVNPTSPEKFYLTFFWERLWD